MFYLLLFFSCLVTFEDTTDRVSLSFEQGETAKTFSVRTPLKSSGKIIIFNDESMLGHGSGNYFKSGKHKFILTAAHVVDHKFNSVIRDGEELVGLEVLHIDRMRDIAILAPERELQHIDAKNLRVRRSSDLIGKNVYYSGFPQDMEKCLFRGFVSKDTDDFLIMQSFALPGSSGSVVFDYWGRAIGVVSAVKVGFTGMSPFPELVETAVIVQKIGFIDHGFIKELFLNDRPSAL